MNSSFTTRNKELKKKKRTKYRPRHWAVSAFCHSDYFVFQLPYGAPANQTEKNMIKKDDLD